MPSRRAFLIGCGGAVAAPAVARLRLSSPAGNSPTVLEVGDIEPPALRVDGWDSAAGPDDAWVQINSSWRATWR